MLLREISYKEEVENLRFSMVIDILTGLADPDRTNVDHLNTKIKQYNNLINRRSKQPPTSDTDNQIKKLSKAIKINMSKLKVGTPIDKEGKLRVSTN